MEYGRLEPTRSVRITEQLPAPKTPRLVLNKRCLLYSLVLVLVLVIPLTVVLVHVTRRHKHQPNHSLPSPSSILTTMCATTPFPHTCEETLGEHVTRTNTSSTTSSSDEGYEGGFLAQGEIVEVSLNVTVDFLRNGLEHLTEAIKGFDAVRESLQWAAHDDCIFLIQDSLQILATALPEFLVLSSRSFTTDSSSSSDQHHRTQVSTTMDIMTGMTTTCSNHGTCMEGLEEAYGPDYSSSPTALMLQDLFQVVSNHIGLTSLLLLNNDTYDGLPTRRLMGPESTTIPGYPKWLSKKKREFLDMTMADIAANITVSGDGVGPNTTVKTIGEAIQLAPKNSLTPFIIHVKAGRYQELNLTVAKNKPNLWFIGDGKGKTIITGNKSYGSTKTSTFKTASFGALGYGLVARGITFENTAGPENHQAVALLVKSDKSVFYECEMKGYQDTLYTHSNRQFYTGCDIYGTVDFIFGNAQVVFQNCSIFARKPMEKQKNTITAQKGSCPGSVSGISIHRSRILAAPDLEPVKSNYSTYLGRPWTPLATVVYMLSYMGDHVHPKGWLPWNTSSPLPDTVYYAEFMNYGPGANTTDRAQSQGVHANISVNEALQFTVDHFVDGTSWIPATSIPFEPELGSLDQHGS